MNNKRRMTHTVLIKLNGIRVKLQDELKSFEDLSVNENQKNDLMIKISAIKVMIKEIDIIELNIRDLL